VTKFLIDMNSTQNIFTNGACDKAIVFAAEMGHMRLVLFFIERGLSDWDCTMSYALLYASKGGHRDIVEYLVRSGATSWKKGMMGAIQGGHWELASFFEAKGATEWNVGMAKAAERADKERVDYFIKKGANEWIGGLKSAVTSGDITMVEFFVYKISTSISSVHYATDAWREAAMSAIENRQIHFVDYFVCKLETADRREFLRQLDHLLATAALNGDREIVDYLLEMGAKNLREALRNALNGNHVEMVRYIISLGTPRPPLFERYNTRLASFIRRVPSVY
jgi:ankyrin repeat protein